MDEAELAREGYLMAVVADQRHQIAKDKLRAAESGAETDGLALTLGRKLEVLLLLQDVAQDYLSARGSWFGAGDRYVSQSDQMDDARRKCERTIKSIEISIADEVWELHESPKLDPVLRRLVICEALRQVYERPISSLVEAYRADPVLSKPETWNGVEFPWVKTDG